MKMEIVLQYGSLVTGTWFSSGKSWLLWQSAVAAQNRLSLDFKLSPAPVRLGLSPGSRGTCF